MKRNYLSCSARHMYSAAYLACIALFPIPTLLYKLIRLVPVLAAFFSGPKSTQKKEW
jgi:hypothetical protein